MPLVAEPITRIFNYNGVTLPDPNPALSADAVRDFHAAAFPELATAKTHVEPSSDGTKQNVTFTRAAGTKG